MILRSLLAACQSGCAALDPIGSHPDIQFRLRVIPFMFLCADPSPPAGRGIARF